MGAGQNHIRLPSQFIIALAGFETIGAILFLIRRTVKIGAYVLLAVFIIATIIHILHGQYDFGGLLVYDAAVIAVAAYKSERE